MNVETAHALLKLETGGAVLELAPGIGGGIASLVLDGQDILRRTTSTALAEGSPLGLAEFPMAPWVNRVANGQFSVSGRPIVVASEEGGDPLGLHGLVWRRAWNVTERSSTSALLSFNWAPKPSWPFAFEVARRFDLSRRALSIDSTIRNLDSRPMPAALGFHPYFPSPGARLFANVSAVWSRSVEGLPVDFGPTEDCSRLRAGVAVDLLDLDHCFTGWDGSVVVEWPTHRISLTTSPALSFLQIYTPRGEEYVCVEPQTAMPDALNRAPEQGGLSWLESGAELRTQLTMTLEPV